MSSYDAGISPPLDIVLIGGGIMSATLGMLLRKLEPQCRILLIERLGELARESSSAWNNAGTGHSAFCEVNYTPELPDGTISITKAEKIAEQFQLSREFWAALVRGTDLPDPQAFLHSVPHMSFVMGERAIDFLRRRHAAMTRSPLFESMEFSRDPKQIATWIPLMMTGRNPAEPVAVTRMEAGTDVDFGALTKGLFARLAREPGFEVRFGHEVRTLERQNDGSWRLGVFETASNEETSISSRFVFIGAGGGALPLLERSGIPEAEGYAGFPVSGQWLRCTNRSVIERHHAKVYGRPESGSPPMSMPHLDSRIIDGKRELLFGPYAGFSTKFLKHGSRLDLIRSVDMHNLRPLLEAGADNLHLMGYLLGQVLQTRDERLEVLRSFYPTAESDDWELIVAGQRVQIIKDEKDVGGVLEFGTEVVASSDGTLAALLGASPGASTAVAIMLDLLKRCFSEQFDSPRWKQTLETLVPSQGRRLAEDPQLYASLRADSARSLGLGLGH